MLMTCHPGKARDEFVRGAYAIAVTTQLRTWESVFVTRVRRVPPVRADRIRVCHTTWTPEDGFSFS